MKVYITYFYNIRHFPEGLVPISTAAFDQSWYHAGMGNDNIFTDKRGIVNGFRIEELNPTHIEHSTECVNCDKSKVGNCKFLNEYRRYIYSLNFKEIVKKMIRMVKSCNGNDICLMVYEKPDNPCSERTVLKEWFEDNGYELFEWERP